MTTKDETARQTIITLVGYTHYIGMTTTELTNGATTNPVVINGKDITAKIGDIVVYGSKEFILVSQFPKDPNGLVWREFRECYDRKEMLMKLYSKLNTVVYNISKAQADGFPKDSVIVFVRKVQELISDIIEERPIEEADFRETMLTSLLLYGRKD